MQNFTPSKNAFLNKIFLVTGAGDGIGKCAAKTYANYGATVILLGKTVSKLEKVYDEIVEKGGPEPAIIPLDLMGASEQNYIDMGHTIEDQFGQLDGLLHNASILGNLQPFEQIPEKEFNDVMQVNVNSQFLMTKALIPVLKKANNASVIFTTSTVGSKGRAYWGSYSISKFATEGMMQVLADEFSNGTIRFNCINPGGTKTSMRAKAFPGEDSNLLKTPEDIMSPYLYLMDSESVAVTGQTFKAQLPK